MTTIATRPTPTHRPVAPTGDRTAHLRPEPLPRVHVAVHCDDALSAAGLEALLRDCADLVLVPRPERGAADVQLLVLDRVRLEDLTAADPAGRPRPRRVLVVAELDAHDFALARSAGVVGVLWRRDVTRTSLAALLRAAAAAPAPQVDHVRAAAVHAGAHAGSHASPAASSSAEAALSEREIEVLRMLAAGSDTREIAHRLCYSERTVKTVIQDITRRFGLRNRSHAVAYAVRHGLA
ncbi:response regulator transcription factor [Cellulomonas sp. 179-A 4D5 NHS]|uniref:helix-turn-helix transcriptional regulator n=1 Tax=Cellulomonas sp. 179-A 4D5 NHS TaxID=3142378 RepID=UPI0039A30D09